MVVSCQQVREFIEKEFGVVYTLSGVNKLLYRLGYSFKQLSLFPSKLDVVKQAEFVAYYRDLEDSLTDHQVILFMPACRRQGWGTSAQYKYLRSMVKERRKEIHSYQIAEDKELTSTASTTHTIKMSLSVKMTA